MTEGDQNAREDVTDNAVEAVVAQYLKDNKSRFGTIEPKWSNWGILFAGVDSQHVDDLIESQGQSWTKVLVRINAMDRLYVADKKPRRVWDAVGGKTKEIPSKLGVYEWKLSWKIVAGAPEDMPTEMVVYGGKATSNCGLSTRIWNDERPMTPEYNTPKHLFTVVSAAFDKDRPAKYIVAGSVAVWVRWCTGTKVEGDCLVFPFWLGRC